MALHQRTRRSPETDDKDVSFPVTCQFYDTFLATSIAELYVHRDQLVCVTRSQVYLLRFNRDNQLEWKNVFDCEHDLDCQGKLRKIRCVSAHGSVYAIVFQDKTPKILLRVDLESDERMFFTHKLPCDAKNFAVDPEKADRVWVVREDEVASVSLKERNFQLMENERQEESGQDRLVRGKAQVEGLTFTHAGDAYFVYEHNTIKKYSAAKNELILVLEGHLFEIEKMVFSRNMDFVARWGQRSSNR